MNPLTTLRQRIQDQSRQIAQNEKERLCLQLEEEQQEHRESIRRIVATHALNGLLASGRWEFVRPDNFWEWQGPPYPDLVSDAIELADQLLTELDRPDR